MNKRELLIIDPAQSPGGAEGYVLTLCQAAKENGWSVSVAFNMTPSMNSFRDALAEIEVKAHHLDVDCVDSNLKSVPAHLMMAKATLRLLRRVKPSVAQFVAPWPGNALGVSLALAVQKTPGLIVVIPGGISG